MSKIQAILFDFGGTLDNDGMDWFSRLYKAIVAQIGDFPYEVFQKAADMAAGDASVMPDTPALSMDEMVLRLSKCISSRMDGELPAWNPQKVADKFMEQARGYLKRNHSILNKLQQKYRLGCISNNWGNTAGWCRQFNFWELFDVIVDSTRAGTVKPDAAIFQAALDDIKLPAHACAYVGDRLDCDIAGAHNAGLTPVWINRPECPVQDNRHIPENLLRITSLQELLDIDL